MRKVGGAELTVGDIGITIDVTTNEVMSGKDIEVIVVKPSGATFRKNVTSISDDGYTASYSLVTGDVDEEGEYSVYLRNNEDGYEYKVGANTFLVRPKAEDMAKY